MRLGQGRLRPDRRFVLRLCGLTLVGSEEPVALFHGSHRCRFGGGRRLEDLFLMTVSRTTDGEHAEDSHPEDTSKPSTAYRPSPPFLADH